MKLLKDKSKTTTKQKLHLAFIGLVILPLLIELFLRTTAFIYYKFENTIGRKSITYDEDSIRILCFSLAK